MPDAPSVSARFGSAVPATAVAGRLLLAMAARTTLDIDAVDEFVMAVDLALATCPPGEVRLEARVVESGLEVIVGPVDAERLANREPLLASLVDQVELRGEEVALRAGI
jgi:hypothetical protein